MKTISKMIKDLKYDWYNLAPLSNIEIEYDSFRQAFHIKVIWYAHGEKLNLYRYIILDELYIPESYFFLIKDMHQQFYESMIRKVINDDEI